jgi:mono/diheme cytochrome c family protein
VAGAAAWVRRPDLPAAERGRRVAERAGCAACHGPDGIRGTPNPGRQDGSVPTYEGDVMMFADGADEIRQWIRDGATAKRAQSESWRAARARGALRMPAFKGRLSEREIDDLVAFVVAMSGAPEPPDGPARHGRERAQALGCFGCHGSGGRLARPNPGSLKGYVPSWDGRDFAELVRDRGEFGEWVEDGVAHRLRADPVARYFLRRATLHMPAFRRHLEPGDVDSLWAYVAWLRGTPAPGSPAARAVLPGRQPRIAMRPVATPSGVSTR